MIIIILLEAGVECFYFSPSMFSLRILFWYIIGSSTLFAQFVDVQVTIDDTRLKENHRRITGGLKNQIKMFFETTSWDQEYGDLQIPLSIHLIFDTVSDKGGINIYSAQCLFSSGLDQRYFAKIVHFPYSSGQGVIYSPVLFEPLASTLQYYGYIILAGEADTYEQFAGTRFYEMARELTFRGKSSQYPRGWSDRVDLVDQLTNNRGLRLAKFFFYEGFTLLQEDNIIGSTESFLKMIENFNWVSTKFPRERYTSIFLDAHAQELANLPKQFKQQKKILTELIQIDPDNEDIYKAGLGIKSE
ncbi:MAG: DUF4835 family protein [Candidatus Marinimicrobia bacterium]|nr:DUF4835 family protein [Candidatus Neomarinimicrobiota bacterium]